MYGFWSTFWDASGPLRVVSVSLQKSNQHGETQQGSQHCIYLHGQKWWKPQRFQRSAQPNTIIWSLSSHPHVSEETYPNFIQPASTSISSVFLTWDLVLYMFRCICLFCLLVWTFSKESRWWLQLWLLAELWQMLPTPLLWRNEWRQSMYSVEKKKQQKECNWGSSWEIKCDIHHTAVAISCMLIFFIYSITQKTFYGQGQLEPKWLHSEAGPWWRGKRCNKSCKFGLMFCGAP